MKEAHLFLHILPYFSIISALEVLHATAPAWWEHYVATAARFFPTPHSVTPQW